ncbi:MAG: hypothetical protein PWQ97_89 [Tepidanaerobacteraceae bacterium]|nr:hypothetical protein [Tepidanaerobacteraceae bacterium]
MQSENLSERKAERYEEIIRAAFDVFIEKGFHQTKMEEIARKAGVGKGTLYEYFPGKKELFCGMVKQCMTWYFESIKKSIELGENFRQKIENMMDVHIKYAVYAKKLTNLMFHDFTYISRDLHMWIIQSQKKIVRLVENVLQQGKDEGILRQVDVHLAAVMFLTSWRIFFAESICNDGEDAESLEKIKEKALDILFHGIALNI